MVTEIANVEQAAAWNGEEGDDWADDWERYDRSVACYRAHFNELAAVAAGERVLDVGCGTGESTRDAARASGSGPVLGIDLSARMLDRARELSAAEGLTNIHYEQGDAQVHPFPPAAFDVAVSRFAGMFFDDKVAAFANIGAALRPGGRLVVVAWQGLSQNEWITDVLRALSTGRDLPTPPAGAPGPFGLADPVQSRSWAEAVGFVDVDLEAVAGDFYLGPDAQSAFEIIRTGGLARGYLGGADDATVSRALDELHRTMVDHDSGSGVVFGSGVWMITGQRP